MNKVEIVKELDMQYGKFIDYLQGLNTDELEFRCQEKWSAREQLEHIVMCIKPVVQVFEMPKPLIKQNFGEEERKNRSYQELLDEYLQKLSVGGKAPIQYIPKKDNTNQKDQLVASLKSLVDKLTLKLDGFEEYELESLVIPHPLLGKITLKEMLYNVIYHVQHHKNQAIKNLDPKDNENFRNRNSNR